MKNVQTVSDSIDSDDNTNRYCNQAVPELRACFEECEPGISSINVPNAQDILLYCNEYEDSESVEQ